MRSARWAVTAAALALAGVLAATVARLQAATEVSAARGDVASAAERLGAMLSTAMATAKMRADGLAAMPTVRGAVETDVATVRDMARAEGFVFVPGPKETIEIFQLAPHRRPLSLLRAPETDPTLAITRADDVRIQARGGELEVIEAAPSTPLYAHGGLRGAVAVAMRVDLSALESSLQAAHLGAELVGIGEPLALTSAATDAAHSVVVPVLLPAPAPSLSLRASVHAGGGGLLWAGRLLLVAALAAALFAFVAHRRRAHSIEIEAEPAGMPEARMHREPNAPAQPLAPAVTAKEKRGSDGNHLVLAWSANMPTPITQLQPRLDSLPITVDARADQLGGRYRLLSQLGHGSNGEVWLAQSFVPAAPGTVALKLLAEPASPDTMNDRGAFLEAARKQMRVAHVNVAQVVDVGDGPVAYVAMEYVEGCTLEALLRDLFARDEPLPLPQTVTIMAAICRALDAARPLVHGAVKPSNVLVGRHNQVKLADFGAQPSVSDRHAPEQYAGRAPDRRSDVFAAGVILHELVTGKRMDAPSGDPRRWPPLPAPSTIRPGLPRALDEIVAKATRFGPRGRYATAGELLFALLGATDAIISTTPTAWLGDWVERARRWS